LQLALFDFDGTITTKDSLEDFIQYAVGTPKYYMGLCVLAPMLIAYILKLVKNNIAKEKLIAHFFKGWNVDNFQKLSEQYSLEQIDKITRPKAMEKIKWHQEQGHKIVIVSASMECWLKPWCDKNSMELISTKLEIKENKLTGKFSTKNCYAIEKANRVKESYNLSEYDCIYAYGDSRGDKELLELSQKSFYKPFQ
jgi:HAD superfamily hydrolase (TIGR01490 family)